MTPRFSILTPTKNRPQYLLEQLAAIQAQDFENWELLLLDSSDEPVRYLVPNDERIKYDYVPGWTFGEKCTRLLNEAAGDIRVFAWDDDWLSPGALSHVDWRIGNAGWLYGLLDVGPGKWLTGKPWNYEELKRNNRVPCNTAFWTREAQEKVGHPEVDLCCSDWDFWLRLGARYTPIYTERVLSGYRLHDGQVTNVRAQRMAEEEAMIRQRALAGYYDQFRNK